MLDNKQINGVVQNQGRIFNVNSLYRFFEDRDDIADNEVKRWN